MTAVSSRLEDYLEALFHLETTGCKQTVTALAENLKLTKGTIATVVKKMVEQGLVLHESYGSIRLTPKGRQIGWQIYMKHERLTSFFHEFLGQDFERSEQIACLIEHHLDGAAANRFFNLIDFLQTARCDNKDWTKELVRSLNHAGHLPSPLTLSDSKQGKVCRLTAQGKIKQKVADSGIVLHACLKQIDFEPKQGKYTLVADGKAIVLDPDVAATIWIA